MLTPLVIAMPRPMAEALGWPNEPIGFADLVPLANDPAGWGVGRPPRVGPVPPRQDEPQLLDERAQLHDRRVLRGRPARRPGLTVEDLARPAAVEFATQIESAVVHYGDITMTFLNNWFAADARGTSLDLHQRRRRRGEERHRLQPRQPRRRAVAGRGAAHPTRSAGGDLPGGGDAVLGQPVHRARHRVGRRRREGGGGAVRGVRPAAGEPAEGDGVRVPAEQPVGRRWPTRSSPANGVDPTQPTAELRGAVARGARRHPRLVGRAAQGGPGAARARHLRVDGRAGRRQGRTRLDLAQEAAISALDQFKADRRRRAVGVQHRARRRRPERPRARADRPDRRAAGRRSPSRSRPSSRPTARRSTTSPSRRTSRWSTTYDPAKINAIVLLTDGENDDGVPDDDDQQFADLIETLQAGSEGSSSQPVRAVHDLLRRDGRRDHAAGDLPGDQRGDLQRQQPGDDQPGLHRSHQNF